MYSDSQLLGLLASWEKQGSADEQVEKAISHILLAIKVYKRAIKYHRSHLRPYPTREDKYRNVYYIGQLETAMAMLRQLRGAK